MSVPDPMPGPATVTVAGEVVSYSEGSIAARIDRLPIGWTQWRLVLLGQLMWGCVVGLDAVVGRLYPVVWEPQHFVTPLEYQLLLGFSNGLGPLIGNYTFGYISDRFGRRRVMIAACLVAGILYIPVAFLKSFPVLLLTITVAAFGVGAAVCLAPTYNTEISPPAARSKLMLGGNILAFGMLGVGGADPDRGHGPGPLLLRPGVTAVAGEPRPVRAGRCHRVEMGNGRPPQASRPARA